MGWIMDGMFCLFSFQCFSPFPSLRKDGKAFPQDPDSGAGRPGLEYRTRGTATSQSRDTI